MHNITSLFSRLRLAIAPGVPSSQLSKLFALQRAEEPDVTLAIFEVTGDDLFRGLRDGRYDAGVTLQGLNDPSLVSQPLWTEHMAVAVPLRSPLLDHTKLTSAELVHCPVFRWQAETCPLLNQRLSALVPVDEQNIQRVTSFEMMALWVAAGYGIGLSAQSRIQRAAGWGIGMRPLSDGPYEVVTHLQRPSEHVNPVSERFERRALQVAQASVA